jgi:hypothetical protein
MKPNVLPLGASHDWVFPIDSQPSLSHRNLQGPDIQRLHEGKAKLGIHIKKTADGRMAQLVLDDDRVRGALHSVGVIRVH